jgi:copper chaperone
MNTYKFKVHMSCYGCVGAVIKAMSDVGITKVDVDFDNQLVNVNSDKSSDYILDLINKTGKKSVLIK